MYLNWLDRLKPGEEIIKIDQDTFMSKKSLQAAKIGVGCVIGAIDSIVEMQNKNAFCLIRPPGHHAEREKAMGFCFLNNIAIGAKYLKEIKQIDKIAIVDFDVHHGNGTQNILWDDPDCLFISIHQSNLFPFTGLENETGNKNNILNIPVNANSNSFEFRYIVDKVVIPRLKEFQPKFLLISAGFDGEKNDQMSQTQWVESDFIYLTKKIKKFSKKILR
jgi:acetoin utilization deacetylase AcuC-like enzyme